MYIYVYQINIQGVSFIFHYIWSIWQNASLKGVVSFIDFTILLLELILSRVLRLFFVNFAARNKQFHVTSLRKFKKITLLLRFLIYILIYIYFFFFSFYYRSWQRMDFRHRYLVHWPSSNVTKFGIQREFFGTPFSRNTDAKMIEERNYF